MVGDNLEWDVAEPQRQGIYGIWIDIRGRGLPPGTQSGRIESFGGFPSCEIWQPRTDHD